MTKWKHVCGSAFFARVLSALVLLATTLPAAAQTTRPSVVTFAWNVPVADFDKWQARGVNTLMGCGIVGADTPVAREAWARAALAKGLWTIYDPQGGAVLPNMLAFLLPDEMDARESAPKADGTRQWNGWPAERILPLHQAWKAAHPEIPTLMTCAGDHVTQANRLAYYQSIASCSDLWLEDWYPFSSNAVTYSNRLKAQAVSVLRQAAPDKPCWTTIETTLIGRKDSPSARQITPAEFHEAVALTKAAGASGFGVFSHQFNGNNGWVRFDGTPPDVAAQVTAEFTVLAPVRSAPGPPVTTQPTTAPAATQPTIADVIERLNRIEKKLDRKFVPTDN